MYKHIQTIILTTYLLVLIPTVSNAVPCNTTLSTQFTDNGDGSITDENTGLMWKRCSEGQSWNGSACSNSAGGYSWINALKLAESTNASAFLGKTDWRLPNIKELVSITDEQCSGPAVNTIAFPNTALAKYWSSSPAAINSNESWYVDFQNSKTSAISKIDKLPVRLVRNAQQ